MPSSPWRGHLCITRPAVMRKVWETARALGHSKYFLARETDPLIDDHLYINKIAGIPTVDIIHYDDRRGGFPASWHTVGTLWIKSTSTP